MTQLWRKLNAWRRREVLEAELQEEIEAHLEMKTADLDDPTAARRQFGRTSLVFEDARSAWRWPGLESLWQDLQCGSRMLLKAPGFTTVAVLSLALGIGANTAIFSLVDKLLIRKLPVDEPDRLVVISANRDQGVSTTSNYPDFADYRDRNEVFEGLVCYSQRALTLSEGGHAERIQGMIVSGNYFTMLHVRPALGRGFLPEEDKIPGTHPVVVLSYGLWERRFGADPGVVGKAINLNDYRFAVVGIAPPEFSGTIAGSRPDVYVPIIMLGQVLPSSNPDLLFGPRSSLFGWLYLLGRLKPDVSREQAAAAMAVLGSQIARSHPNADRSPRVGPKFLIEDGSRGHTNLLRDIRFPLQMLMATVGLILLIACANVANLLLARAGTRQKEIAIRLATGARRMRLIRQLLTESVLLSTLGAAAGLVLTVSISGLMVSFTPPNNNAFSSLTLDNRLDLRVLGFALAISLLTGILFGLAPALSASRPDLVPALKDEATVLGKRVRRLNLRNFLVVGQVALSVIVLVGASLCVRSLRNLQTIDTGFDPAKVLVMSVDVGMSGYNEERGRRFYSELLERVQRLRGVEAASLATQIALGDGFGAVMRAEGHVPKLGEDISSDFNQIGPDYFRTMKIPLLEGRDFGQSDTTNAPPVAIINQTTARRFWPGQSAIGQRVIVGSPPYDQARVVVGVVRDSKYRRLTEEMRPAVFTPFLQRYRGDMTLHVRTTGEPATMLAAVRGEMQALDGSLPLYNIKTLEEQKSSSLYTSRLAATLLTIFGLLALLLAAVGLYGVMAHAVNGRRREIGIRLALGAQGHEVQRLVMVEGSAMVAIGLVLGLGGALVATRLVESFLYGVMPNDPIAFGGAALLLFLVASLANYLPARQASRTDPIIAIRC
ncbi:MAG: ABC transporter permease [Acidobacteria bacterium]|nr:ABC transporter permease [Acidobacteriota bacterium]